MIRTLKAGRDASAKAADAARVRATVEGILADIETRGDAARARVLGEVRQLVAGELPAERARDRRPASPRLAPRDLDDIKFAQAQIRNFAEIQKAALRDVEVETLPGVVLGHKNIPVEQRRLLRAGRQVSAGRLGAYDRRHRQGRRRQARDRAARRRSGQAGAGDRRRDALWPAPTRSTCLGGVQAVGAMALGTETHRAGRHAGRPRQRLCRRGQAPALRPRRHRSVRRADRDAGHRRRHASTPRCAPPTCSARPSTARPRRRSC